MIRISTLITSATTLVACLFGIESFASAVLYSHGEARVVAEDHGVSTFRPQGRTANGDVVFTSNSTDERLIGARGRYVLVAADGGERRFVGGMEVGTSRDGYTATLPDSIELKRPATPLQEPGVFEALVASEHTDEDACPTACDTEATPPSEDFQSGPSIDEAITLDVRPESCQSYFAEFIGIDRGTRIEQALESSSHYIGTQATVRSFPVVDFIGLGEARVVHTRDLASATYSAPGAVHQRLMSDAREIADDLIAPLAEHGFIERTEQGETTRLENSPPPTIVLEMVVQHGIASDPQIDEIRQAASDLASEWGIVLRIIEIP